MAESLKLLEKPKRKIPCCYINVRDSISNQTKCFTLYSVRLPELLEILKARGLCPQNVKAKNPSRSTVAA